jgi:hypothetical protein
MSKINREIKAVLEDIEAQAKEIMPELIILLTDPKTTDDEKRIKVIEYMDRIKPKTYDTYINDLKLVFKQNGWTAP